MIKVTLTERGVSTIPASVRQTSGQANEGVMLEGTEAGSLLRPSITVPIEIYTEARIGEFPCDETAIGTLLPKVRAAKARGAATGYTAGQAHLNGGIHVP